MIEIKIDEKACVSCGLCVDICPTKVFNFNEEKGVPEVAKPKECFGCLSCSEICPANIIDHVGVSRSEAYYHDPYALDLASKLATGTDLPYKAPGDKQSVAKATEDLGIRLLSMAAVFKQTVGNSLPAVGALAGKPLARHLPRYQSPASLDEALQLTCRQFAPAWRITPTLADGKLVLDMGDCFVRDLCLSRGIPLGEELCVLFYNYLAGYIGRMGKVRLRLVNAERGPGKCRYEATVHT